MANNSRTRRSERDDDHPAIWVGYSKLVRPFRERARLTQAQLAEAVGYSYEQVASIEQGRRPAKAAFTDAAEGVLETDGALRVLQEDVDLARLPVFFQDFALLEAEAVSRFSYDALLIPGLLQTEKYAKTLISAHFPPLDDDVVDERVAARLARQSLLSRTQPPLVFVFIIEEAALHRAVGGSGIMKGQLQHLSELAGRRNIEIQVMPTSRAAHSGLNGPMVLLETTDRQQFVYLESQDQVTVISRREQVSEFWMRYGMLRTQALNTEESAHLICMGPGSRLRRLRVPLALLTLLARLSLGDALFGRGDHSVQAARDITGLREVGAPETFALSPAPALHSTQPPLGVNQLHLEALARLTPFKTAQELTTAVGQLLNLAELTVPTLTLAPTFPIGRFVERSVAGDVLQRRHRQAFRHGASGHAVVREGPLDLAQAPSFDDRRRAGIPQSEAVRDAAEIRKRIPVFGLKQSGQHGLVFVGLPVDVDEQVPKFGAVVLGQVHVHGVRETPPCWPGAPPRIQFQRLTQVPDEFIPAASSRPRGDRLLRSRLG
ncbi:helix-turn-helix transcriptional regulator [Streptomyces sp. NPDC051920]|uniref:helix-turn-helix domain-containing protein n=1 Tax=Streptomyces sp. NPDC051920 TaxID=3155523 RepID=UPI0034388B39